MIATAPANTTFASQLALLNTAYQALSYEDKMRCICNRDGGTYHIQNASTYGTFCRVQEGNSRIQVVTYDLPNATYKVATIPFSGNGWEDDNSSTNDATFIQLIRI